MKHHHHTEPDTTFMQRAGGAARRHWLGAVIAVVMSTITGTVVPMLEQWHSDKMTADAIAASEARLQKQIDDNRKTEKDDTDALWRYHRVNPEPREPK